MKLFSIFLILIFPAACSITFNVSTGKGRHIDWQVLLYLYKRGEGPP